ncbi:MAG TPA: methyltransferase [Steroidobacteraceae bacterium]|jgi:protein-S-isoprenylcysteine O-methyltransferase Ste14
MRHKVLASGLKIIANVVVILALGLLAYAGYINYRATGSLNWLGLLIVNCVSVSLYIAKRDAAAISRSPPLWLLAFAGTCLPLILRPTSPAASAGIGNAIQLLGLCAVLAALLSLRRSYGIVPAHRGIRTEGLYHLVRHPLYASELVWMLGFAIANPSPWNIGLWLTDCVLQFTRACAEEQFLSTDPVYSHYRARVRYRLIPRLI